MLHRISVLRSAFASPSQYNCQLGRFRNGMKRRSNHLHPSGLERKNSGRLIRNLLLRRYSYEC
jgi:hypothetical protein